MVVAGVETHVGAFYSHSLIFTQSLSMSSCCPILILLWILKSTQLEFLSVAVPHCRRRDVEQYTLPHDAETERESKRQHGKWKLTLEWELSCIIPPIGSRTFPSIKFPNRGYFFFTRKTV